jgi:4-amino-4-deoxy-L-arabinose transferase-like glycosyltransferase
VHVNDLRASAERLAPLWVALVAIAAVLIAPIGYVGGGADDTHYLDAARCWSAAGFPCLPDNHWASRWPAVAPIAVATGLLGESRLTVGLGPLAAWIACIGLVAALGSFWFDRATGYLAAALIAATPVVSQVALQPGADTAELAFQLAALLLATLAYNRQSPILAVVAGVMAAIAVQARDTSILFCGASCLAWFLLQRGRRNVLLWAFAGIAAVVALDLISYSIATGDPFFRYRLALGHVNVPSAELAASVDTSRSPLFNPDYIAGWKREAGIQVWWPIDPWLNLLWSPRIGSILLGTLLVLPIGWTRLPRHWKRLVLISGGFALLVSAGLIYGLAVDPKPRMFFALVAACSLALAAVTVAAVRNGRGAVPGTITALVAAAGLFILSMFTNTHALEAHAREWIRANPNAIEIDPSTISTLTLVSEARSLPLAGSGRPLRIHGTNATCAAFRQPVVARVGDSGAELCLLRNGPISPRQLTEKRAGDRSNPA